MRPPTIVVLDGAVEVAPIAQAADSKTGVKPGWKRRSPARPGAESYVERFQTTREADPE
jgi:hypothetical protein